MVKKKLCLLLVLLLLMCGVASCGNPKEDPIRLENFESKQYPKDKHFVFFADYPPSSDPSLLATYAEAGFTAFNLIPWPESAYENGFDMENPTDNGLVDTLGKLETLGLDALIWGCADPGVPGAKSPDITMSNENRPGLLYPGLNLFDYSSFFGFYVKDEPSANDFAYLGEDVAVFWNENYADNGAYWHINLYPSYATNEQLGTTAGGGKTAYRNYVDRYVEEVLNNVQGRKGIGMDHYALKPNGVNDMYLYDLNIVAQAAKETNATLHNCIQALGGASWRVSEDIAEVRWNYYTSLAFGTQVFEVFAYKDDPNQGFHCMIGAEKNQMYYFQQALIAELKRFEHVYLSFDWEGIFPVIGTENELGTNGSFELLEADGRLLESLVGITDISATQDTLVGQFQDGEDRAFLVMNATDPTRPTFDSVTLTFENCKRVIVYQNGEEYKYAISGNKLEIPLLAGEGVFVIPQK